MGLFRSDEARVQKAADEAELWVKEIRAMATDFRAHRRKIGEMLDEARALLLGAQREDKRVKNFDARLRDIERDHERFIKVVLDGMGRKVAQEEDGRRNGGETGGGCPE